MINLYTVLSTVIIGTTLFAMDKDKKEDNSSKAPSYSYRMESTLSEIRANTEKGEATATYTYPDGSRTTYFRYKDSSND